MSGKEYFDNIHLFPTNKCNVDLGGKNYELTVHGGLCYNIENENSLDPNSFLVPCMNVATYINSTDKTCPIENKTLICKYINYSINAFIRNNRVSKDKKLKFIKAYQELFSELKECNNVIENMEDGIFAKVDDIYNMYNNYNKIITGVPSTSSDCANANNCVNIYSKYQSICNQKLDDHFCNALRDYKNYYYSKIGSAYTACPNIITTLPSFDTMDESLGSQVAVYDAPEEDDDTDEVPSDLIFIYLNALIIFSIILATSLILFILYKFTPFGIWIRPLLLRKKNIWNNICEKKLQLYDNTRHEQIKSQNEAFNLQYDSLINS
ncbi:PIR Superfamily Protein [Plasmodium ovale wallikeri]|uniref:PIR Superfamily Protein n=2 Tax=Plasmodium ovale TaxID=36330 RepID=A0A1A8YP01_PLAOA|nr:PIR Superfamily Protein [Plasmodium ovale wallikeri]SBT58896.1 PIR Superfamily Protein [Plasmodium ovale wallikeri]SBT73357.1 PIR protein [Plasmodium ovale]